MTALQEIMAVLLADRSYQLLEVEELLLFQLEKCMGTRRIHCWVKLCQQIERELKETVKIPRIRVHFLIVQLRLMTAWLGKYKPPASKK